MKTLPTLYKKTSTGAIQFWEIRSDMHGAGYGRIETCFGQMGTDKPQVTEDIIENGKNVGKKNETTPYEQAQAEALAKWKNQKKKGYVESKEAAEKGEVDDLIEGGIVPMLAHKFSDHGRKIIYPAYIQPKLDGIRCIAILKDGKCTLWSRSRKPIKSCPHIVAEIEKRFVADIILDGELYNHRFRSNAKDTIRQIPEGEITISKEELGFEHIVHLVRQDEPDPNCTDVQYHVYDLVNEDTFEKRNSKLLKCFTIGKPKLDYLIMVSTGYVPNENVVPSLFSLYMEKGYEGAMLRNADSLYVNKRSYDLQKVKEMQDDEFEIIGIDEGRGKLTGHVGAFVCLTKDGKEFLAKMSGDTARLKEYFENHKLWKGKQLTVKYQGLTGANGVPRFPVGVIIRDYE